ncbi:hypothetical protein [Singulisphaera sp. PoT]|uniref:hypothetical protein n=1 Tax=Singulisphaera sp. PoT TaxID=3411797 RepID=UPI003BF4A71C
MSPGVPDVVVETDAAYHRIRISVIADLADMLPRDGTRGDPGAVYREVLRGIVEESVGGDGFAAETTVAIAQRTASRYLRSWAEASEEGPGCTPNVLVDESRYRIIERCLQAEVRIALLDEDAPPDLDVAIDRSLSLVLADIVEDAQRYPTGVERETAMAVALRTAEALRMD